MDLSNDYSWLLTLQKEDNWDYSIMRIAYSTTSEGAWTKQPAWGSSNP